MTTPEIKRSIVDISTELKTKNRLPIEQYYIYLFPVIIIFLMLIVFRPKFIHTSTIVGDKVEYKFSFSKFIMYWIVFSLVIVVGIYTYKYKQSH